MLKGNRHKTIIGGLDFVQQREISSLNQYYTYPKPQSILPLLHSPTNV